MQLNGAFNLSHKTKRAKLRMAYVRTPEEIWNKIKTKYNFTVDACASDKNHLLPKYWTKENSALDQTGIMKLFIVILCTILQFQNL